MIQVGAYQQDTGGQVRRGSCQLTRVAPRPDYKNRAAAHIRQEEALLLSCRIALLAYDSAAARCEMDADGPLSTA
jgi:hypothetical protein